MKVSTIASLIQSQVDLWVPVSIDEITDPSKLEDLKKASPVLRAAGNSLIAASKKIDSVKPVKTVKSAKAAR